MKSIKQLTTYMLIIFGFIVANAILLPSITPVSAVSADICTHDVPDEVKAANGCDGNTTTDLQSVITTIINSIVGVLGLVAVIFIVVGGVSYMTSAGDSAKIEKAKKTILYATIGLIICVLAFAIVNFVISDILN